MIVSPGSNGISKSSNVKLGISSFLAVALAADHVERTKGRNHVGHHRAGDDAFETARDVVARRTDAHAVGRAAAVAHDVEAELAVAAFGERVHLAGGQLQAF